MNHQGVRLSPEDVAEGNDLLVVDTIRAIESGFDY